VNDTDQALEERGLAGTIRPDESMDGSLCDLEVHASQDGRVPVGLGDFRGSNHGKAGYPPRMSEPSRCQWCGTDSQYVAYHDEEWGVPVRDDVALFSKLILDTFQSGLSWLVVLRKRAAILEVMDDLNPRRLATWDTSRIEQAIVDERIIRNRAKIEAAVHNAGCFMEIEQSGLSFSDLLWSHVGGKTIVNRRTWECELPGFTPESESMARDLKSRGFKWTGPTVCYAFMQAVGMVNDHRVECFRWKACC